MTKDEIWDAIKLERARQEHLKRDGKFAFTCADNHSGVAYFRSHRGAIKMKHDRPVLVVEPKELKERFPQGGVFRLTPAGLFRIDRLKPHEPMFVPVHIMWFTVLWRRCHSQMVWQAIQAVVAVVGMGKLKDEEHAGDCCVGLNIEYAAGWRRW